MILLDTNVISELMRPLPAPNVLAWLDSQIAPSLFLSAVSAGELLAGVAALPTGRRRDTLAQAVTQILDEEFRDRVLPFDTRAAVSYALIREERSRLGKPIGAADAMIAATARATGMSVATRNIRDFEEAGVHLINPWGV
ncbi:type II toxin-antitoxin system VapC family toxin [Kocuria carniphila]|uniref:type II toxin-antitoxin system VapC family toxin n=1 Tax=Kocuria carniphila TaxID=262208 RepID=UPI00101C4A71|nr:type II toxin-antitoxin system VapC family toxin [Kocuria carniphila]